MLVTAGLLLFSLPGQAHICDGWRRAKATGDAFHVCKRRLRIETSTNSSTCWRSRNHDCPNTMSQAQLYSCWNAGWPLTSDEAGNFRFDTLAALISSHVKVRKTPYYVAVGGTDAETKLEGIRGLCLDMNGVMCQKEAQMQGIVGRVSPESLVAALRAHDAPLDFDIIKIDVDSIECPLLDSLMSSGYRPRVIVAEASPAWPPPLLFRREAAEYDPPQLCPRARNKWILVGGEFFYGCSLQEIYEVLHPHGYELLQYAMEDAFFVRRTHIRMDEAALATASLTPSTAFMRGNPHLYFRNNAGNTTVSRTLLEAVRHFQVASRERGHSAAHLLETTVELFESHSNMRIRELPQRVGFHDPVRGRVWRMQNQTRQA